MEKDNKHSRKAAAPAKTKPNPLKAILGDKHSPELEKAINSYIGSNFVGKADLSKVKAKAKDFRAQLAEMAEKRKGNVDWAAKEKDITAKYAAELKARDDRYNAYRLNNELISAKAKNPKAVMALLDHSKITFTDGAINGLAEQLNALKGGKDGYLFDLPSPPKGTDFKSNPEQYSGDEKSIANRVF